ncbi:MAG: alpha/beta fold hydrolase [Rhodospirillales bacterium]|jgi:homoserine O-acetyltransferase|nr:alpha/beta fold hydrolase [Rhodospirillales bacterium]
MLPMQFHTIRDFRLAGGAVLAEARIAYLTLGTLAPGGRNAVLVTHGYTSGPRMIEGGESASEGSWAALVGPGRPIDTDRYFVVASNMLGSSFGSTNAASIDPASGRPYGSRFPEITVGDIVAAQKHLLEALGVRHLVAVVGPSYGGFQAFQWAVDNPEFMHGIVPVVTGLRSPVARIEPLLAQLAQDPNWNGGDYYDRGGVAGTTTEMRIETLKGYGLAEGLAERFPDPAAREAELRRIARAWAEQFDANSLVILRKAMLRYDVASHLPRIRARVLYVLSSTDKLFPPSLAPEVMGALQAAGVSAEYVPLESPFGHLASGLDADRWAPALRAFLRSLPSG